MKRYCKALTLNEDPAIIAKYVEAHSMHKFWSRVAEGMKSIGIVDMELYLYGNIVFMIMDTTDDFEHQHAMKKLANMPEQQAWEKYVSDFQNISSNVTAEKKWRLLERIYELDQSKIYAPLLGQQKD